MSDARVLAGQAEQDLCAAVMWSGRLPDVPVDADMFASEAHRTVWEAVVASHPDCDAESVANLLARTGKLEVVGGIEGFYRVARTDRRTPVDQIAREVQEWASRRKAARVARQVWEASQDLSQDPSGLLDALDGIERRPSRLTVHAGDAIRKLPRPSWLVDRVVQDGTAVIFGPWASGKSFLAVDLSVAVASGTDWFGHRTQQRRVLYLALEGAAGVGARMAEAAESRRVGLDGLLLSGDPVNLTSPKDVGDVDRAVADHKVGLLVVDTWARSTAGADENDNGQVGRAVEALDRIRVRRGCAVWVVHHTGTQDTDRPRGASALPAAAESMIAVTKSGSEVAVRSVKQKDGEDFRRMRFQIVARGGSAVLQSLDRPGDPAQIASGVSSVAGELRFGRVLKAAIRAEWGEQVVAEVARLPGVVEVLDEADRPAFELREVA